MTGKRHNPQFGKLLVGFDGSKESEKALDAAFSLAKSMDSSVFILSVARPPEPATSVEVQAVLDNAKEQFEENFNRIREKASEYNIDLQTATAVGHPAEQIIRRAQEDGVDLIILGRRGRSMLSRIMLGSVSERTLRYAHCPVMVVH